MAGKAATMRLRRNKRAQRHSAGRASAKRQSGRELIISLKRAYDPPASGDGTRVLVDRVWPRGVSKQKMRIDGWLPELGPSTPSRTWFGHDPVKWEGFRRRYREELAQKPDLLHELIRHAKDGKLTLVYGARDPEHNQAVVIKEVLEGSPGIGDC